MLGTCTVLGVCACSSRLPRGADDSYAWDELDPPGAYAIAHTSKNHESFPPRRPGRPNPHRVPPQGRTTRSPHSAPAPTTSLWSSSSPRARAPCRGWTAPTSCSGGWWRAWRWWGRWGQGVERAGGGLRAWRWWGGAGRQGERHEWDEGQVAVTGCKQAFLRMRGQRGGHWGDHQAGTRRTWICN